MKPHKFGHLLGEKVTGIATSNLSKDGTEVAGLEITFSNGETVAVYEQYYDSGGWGTMLIELRKKKK